MIYRPMVLLPVLVFLALVGLVSFVVWLFLRVQRTAESVAAAQKATGARLDQVDTAQKTTGAQLETVNTSLFQTGARVDSVSSNLADLDARALGVAQGTAVGVAQVPKQVDGKVADLQDQVTTDFDQKLLAQAADVDRQIKTQVTTDTLRIGGNWMFLPGTKNALFLTDDRHKGLGNLVLADSKANRMSAGSLTATKVSAGGLSVKKHAAFQKDVAVTGGVRAKRLQADSVRVGKAATLTAEKGGDGKFGASRNLLLGAGGNVVVQSKLLCMGTTCLSATDFARLAHQANPAQATPKPTAASKPPSPATPTAPTGNRPAVVLGVWGMRPWGARAKFVTPTAMWIWSTAGAAKSAPPGTVAFTRDYNSTSGADVTAMLHIIVDNSVDVTLNGKSVGSGTGGWDRANYPKLPVTLTPGLNKFEFNCGNAGNKPSPAGMIYSLVSSSGEVLMTSDASTQVK